MNIEQMLTLQPYGMKAIEKNEYLCSFFEQLTKHHIENCAIYSNIITAKNTNLNFSAIEDVPFIPVSLFKHLDLLSTSENEIFKTMKSSGSTGQTVSKVFLDRETANNQTKVLNNILSSFIGTSRLPLLVLDSKEAVLGRKSYSARNAGVIGFSIYGRNVKYALNDDMSLNLDVVNEFISTHSSQPVLLFGYTFMVWEHLYKTLKSRNNIVDFGEKAKLFHIGGWKKLRAQAVTNEIFKNELLETCGICEVHDYYGMAEQLGSVYVECEEGHLHASIFSDIITRRAVDFTPCEIGETGIIQVLSVLPKSYPGHSLLTEDVGVILGIDDCKCGRLGKYFAVSGRIQRAEVRGCSDTYETRT